MQARMQPSTLIETGFVATFGAVYEHSPWVAQRTWQRGVAPEQDGPIALAALFAATFTSASVVEQLDVIRAHPDLAGKAAVGGELTADSTGEQASAGIDQCTAQEFERFQQLNMLYKKKFEFPFIMAVKGSNKLAILQAFEERLKNDRNIEFDRAIREINKIALLRLEAIL